MSDALRLFFTVFGIIFVAELPDKTALAAVVLATKHRPLPVFLGAALALTIQSVVAIAAGGLFALLPARPVHIGTGILFLGSAVVMWRRAGKEDAGDEKELRAGSFWKSFASVFGVIFVAEWGDLTQLGTAALAARYKSPVIVFSAATAALWAVTGLAVLAGNRAAKVLDPSLTAKIAAGLFALIGVLLVFGWL